MSGWRSGNVYVYDDNLRYPRRPNHVMRFEPKEFGCIHLLPAYLQRCILYLRIFEMSNI